MRSARTSPCPVAQSMKYASQASPDARQPSRRRCSHPRRRREPNRRPARSTTPRALVEPLPRPFGDDQRPAGPERCRDVPDHLADVRDVVERSARDDRVDGALGLELLEPDLVEAGDPQARRGRFPPRRSHSLAASARSRPPSRSRARARSPAEAGSRERTNGHTAADQRSVSMPETLYASATTDRREGDAHDHGRRRARGRRDRQRRRRRRPAAARRDGVRADAVAGARRRRAPPAAAARAARQRRGSRQPDRAGRRATTATPASSSWSRPSTRRCRARTRSASATVLLETGMVRDAGARDGRAAGGARWRRRGARDVPRRPLRVGRVHERAVLRRRGSTRRSRSRAWAR